MLSARPEAISIDRHSVNEHHDGVLPCVIAVSCAGQLEQPGIGGPGLGLRGAARVLPGAGGGPHGAARLRRARAGRRRALRRPRRSRAPLALVSTSLNVLTSTASVARC